MLLACFFLLHLISVVVFGQACTTNCSTFGWSSDGTKSFVSCVNHQKCTNVSVEKAYISAPKKWQSDFYIYPLPNSSYEGIALNFTWGPDQEVTLESTLGYAINIRQSVASDPLFNFSYCLQNHLVFERHRHVHFYYDCFGYSTKVIQPGEKFMVDIEALPKGSLEKCKFAISIPTCDDIRMKNVFSCVLKQQLYLSIKEVNCKNNSVTIYYNVPKEYSEIAEVILFENKSFNTNRHIKKIWHETSSKFCATLSLPLRLKPGNYTAVLRTMDETGVPVSRSVTFTGCLSPPVVFGSHQWAISGMVCIVFITVLLLALFCYINLSRRCTGEPRIGENNVGHLQSLGSENDGARTVVYLVSAKCGPRHDKVLVKLATYMQEELGLEIILHLWDQENLKQSKSDWIEKALKRANKVLYLWTPNAGKMFEDYCDSQKSECELNDLSSPVLRRIKHDKIFNRHVGKYLFAYFEYCGLSGFNEFRGDLQLNIFEVMRDFSTLYFHLIDCEPYQIGGVIDVSKVKNYASTSSGRSLKEEVDELYEYSNNQDSWFLEDENGSAMVCLSSQGILRHRLELDSIEPLSSSPLLKP